MYMNEKEKELLAQANNPLKGQTTSLADLDLIGFNDQAVKQLQTVTLNFARDIVRETNRIEAFHGREGGMPEITSNMVSRAELLVRQGLVKPKRNRLSKVMRGLTAISGVLTGCFYAPEKFGDLTSLALFVFFLVITVIAAFFPLNED